jgi:PTH1 family peptidyl-tRNA hydrolase
MATHIKLIVGLGNPGPSYEHTRHNAGAWFVERLAAEHNEMLRKDNDFAGLIGKITVDANACFLLLPTTYMNLSGKAVSAVANFYKITPEEILVAHDEIDLPPGTVRYKFAGGHGGHNGLRDIIKALDSKNFYRLRLGVGKAKHKEDVADYVLQRPSKAEQQIIVQAIDDALQVLPDVISGNIEKAMKILHTQQ